MSKNWKGDPLGFWNTQSVVKYQRNWRRDFLEKKKWKKVSQCRKTERGDPFRFFNIYSVAKHQKIEVGKNFCFRKKNLTLPKKTERGTLWEFPTSILEQNSKKNWRGRPFGEKNSEKKSRSDEKNWKGYVSPGMVCYAEKKEKLFWFSSLGQMVQFGAIIFCRTFKNYFGQFVWTEKSNYNSRVSLHEAPTKKTWFSQRPDCLQQGSTAHFPLCSTCWSHGIEHSAFQHRAWRCTVDQAVRSRRAADWTKPGFFSRGSVQGFCCAIPAQ